MAGNTVDIKFSSNLDDIYKSLEALKKKLDEITSQPIVDKKSTTETKSDLKAISEEFSKLNSQVIQANALLAENNSKLNAALERRAALEAKIAELESNGKSGSYLTARKNELERVNTEISSLKDNIFKLQAILPQLNTATSQFSSTMLAAMDPESVDKYSTALIKSAEAEVERAKIVAAENKRMQEAKLAHADELKKSADAEAQQIAVLNGYYRELRINLDKNKSVWSAEQASSEILKLRDMLSAWGKQGNLVNMASLQQELSTMFDKLTKLSEEYDKKAAQDAERSVEKVFDQLRLVNQDFKKRFSDSLTDPAMYDELRDRWRSTIAQLDYDSLTDKQKAAYNTVVDAQKKLLKDYWDFQDKEQEKAANKAAQDAEALSQQMLDEAHAIAEAEEAIHNKRMANLETALSIAKTVYNSLNSAANESVKAFRDAFKSIKSEATQLAGILGVEEYASSTSQILKGALSNASALVESENLLNQMYEKDIQLTVQWADKQAYAYGLASNAARSYLGQISGMLMNTGIENEELVETMTKSYTKLAGDLASAFNTTADTAFYAIRSGIAGMSRPLEKFGINLKMHTMQQWLDAKGIEASYIKLSEYNKQMVRYAYIMEQTQKIHGDYSETFKSMANMTKTLKNEWQNFLDLLGKYAVPIFKPIVEWLLTAIEYAKEFIRVFAEIMGLQPYDFEHAAISYYNDVENTTSDLIDTQDDLTKSIKATNKARQKEVKLLDLYTLDFGDNSDASLGTTADEVKDLNADFSQLIKDYGDFKPDFGIDVDTDAVRKVALYVKDIWETIQKIGAWLWDFKLLGFLPSLHEFTDWLVNGLASDPVGTLTKLFLQLFALKALYKVFNALVVPLIANAFKKAIVANPALFSGIGLSIIGLIVSGIAGYNFGEAIAHGDISKEITSGVTTLGGIIATTIGGLILGGPIGAAIGFVASSVTALVLTFVGQSEEVSKTIEQAYTDTKKVGLDAIQALDENSKRMVEDEPYSELSTKIANVRSTFEKEISPIVNDKIPELRTALEARPGDAALLEKLNQAYSDLYGAASQYKTESFKKEIESSFSLFESGAEKVGIATDKVKQYMDKFTEAYNSMVSKREERLKELRAAKEASGGEYTELFTEQDEAELKRLEKFFEVSSEQVSRIDSKIKGTYTNYESVISTAGELVSAIESNQAKLGDLFSGLYEILSDKYGEDNASALIDVIKSQGYIPKEIFDTLSEEDQDLVLYLETAYMQLGSDEISAQSSIAKLETLKGPAALWQSAVAIFNSLLDTNSDKIIDNLVIPDESNMQTLVDRYADELPFDTLPDKFTDAVLKKVQEAFPKKSLDEQKRMVASLYGTMIDGVLSGFVKQNEDGSFVVDLSALSGQADIDLPFGLTAHIDTETNIEKILRGTLEKELASLEGSKYFSVSKDSSNLIYKVKPVSLEFSTVTPKFTPTQLNTMERMISDQVKSSTEASVKTGSAEANTEDGANNVASSYSNNIEESIEDQKNIDKTAAGINANLAGATNAADAESKGKELGESYINGLTSAISAAHNKDSAYNSALKNLVNDFKLALNSISACIEEWSGYLASGISGLNIPEYITFTGLVNMLKTNRLSIKRIPALANGAVIPPNNPFLAVLGDQRSGTNVEAPLSTIREAVAQEFRTPEVTVQNTVYIGNTEIKDYIVDTVIDSNLVTG